MKNRTYMHVMFNACLSLFSLPPCRTCHTYCIIVTWCGEPGEIESYLDNKPPSFGALTLLVGSSDL